MVGHTQKKIQKVGDSYAIFLPKKWVEELHLWKGCALDLFITDTEIILTPDWNRIDPDQLALEIDVAQKKRIAERERAFLKEMRQKLGNEKYSKLQIARLYFGEIEGDLKSIDDSPFATDTVKKIRAAKVQVDKVNERKHNGQSNQPKSK